MLSNSSSRKAKLLGANSSSSSQELSKPNSSSSQLSLLLRLTSSQGRV